MNKKEMKKVLLDTNILVYRWDQSSPFSKSIKVALGSLNHFYITDRTLLEFYRASTGPLKQPISNTLDIIWSYIDSDSCTILYSSKADTLSTFELAEECGARSGKIFDLNILAMAIENDIDILYTKNVKDYPKLDSIKITDPTV
jgi:predicted nucleic acid-binding protein